MVIAFEQKEEEFEIQLEGAHFSVAGNLDAVRVAWPHLDDEVRKLVSLFDEAGLRPKGISVHRPVDADD